MTGDKFRLKGQSRIMKCLLFYITGNITEGFKVCLGVYMIKKNKISSSSFKNIFVMSV